MVMVNEKGMIHGEGHSADQCDQDAVVKVVTRFVDAFNEGDLQELSRLVPLDPDTHQYQYGWYGAKNSDPPDFFTLRHEDLLAYFRSRHNANEHLTLGEIVTGPAFTPMESASIKAQITRSASDLGERSAVARGMVNCQEGTLLWWWEAHPSDPVLVFDQGTRFVTDCGPSDVMTFIMRFFDAYNQGDQEQLREFFPPAALGDTSGGDDNAFQRFYASASSSNAGNGFVYEWQVGDNLLNYFAKRHTAGERLELLQLKVGPSLDGHGAEWFATSLWMADDVSERVARGKGRMTCNNQQIILFNMTDGNHPGTGERG
jgi:hypothetical protein